MKIEINSITINATITPDDPAKSPRPFERTFTHDELPKAAGWIADIFSLAKRYLFTTT